MSDVYTRADNTKDIKNGGFVISACPVFGNSQSEELDYYKNPPVSGVNGVTDNGYLDTRFDDTQYYSS
jgi:hypothetical protein